MHISVGNKYQGDNNYGALSISTRRHVTRMIHSYRIEIDPSKLFKECKKHRLKVNRRPRQHQGFRLKINLSRPPDIRCIKDQICIISNYSRTSFTSRVLPLSAPFNNFPAEVKFKPRNTDREARSDICSYSDIQ